MRGRQPPKLAGAVADVLVRGRQPPKLAGAVADVTRGRPEAAPRPGAVGKRAEDSRRGGTCSSPPLLAGARGEFRRAAHTRSDAAPPPDLPAPVILTGRLPPSGPAPPA